MKRCSSGLTLILVQQDVATFTESGRAVLIPLFFFFAFSWTGILNYSYSGCFLPLVLHVKCVIYFCLFHLAYRARLHPHLRRMDTNWQIFALEMGATARHGMWGRDENICGYKWKAVLCLAKASFKLNAWRKGICACWKQRDECLLLCPPRIPFLWELYLIPSWGNFPRDIATQWGLSITVFYSLSHTNRSPAPEYTNVEVWDGKESFLVTKLSIYAIVLLIIIYPGM